MFRFAIERVLLSLEGRAIDSRDWKRLRIETAKLSKELNRIECDWNEDKAGYGSDDDQDPDNMNDFMGGG